MNCTFRIFKWKQVLVHFRNREFSNFSIRGGLDSILESMTTNITKPSKLTDYHNSNRIVIIGNGAHGGSVSAQLSTSNAGYLFNCGEGTQRLCFEYKVKMNKAHHFFITYPSWKNISGIFGVVLELRSIGINSVHIHSHPSVVNIFEAAARFLPFKNISICFEDVFCENGYSDKNISIKYVVLRPSSPSKNLNTNLSESEPPISNLSNAKMKKNTENVIENYEDNDVDYYDHLGGNPKKRCRIIMNKESVKRNKKEACYDENKEQGKYALSFVCTTTKIAGRLLIEKCIDLGLRPGPVLGLLKSGESITLENGTVINSCDVVGPEFPGTTVIFVECPTEEYLDSLLKEPSFSIHQSNESNPELIASAVVHFTNHKIMESPKYKEWMNRFSQNTKHIIINESNEWLGSMSIHRAQIKLNLIHPDIFPLLYDEKYAFSTSENGNKTENMNGIETTISDKSQEGIDNKTEWGTEEPEKLVKTIYSTDDKPIIKGDTMCIVNLPPKKKIQYSNVFMSKKSVLEEVFQNENFTVELEKLKVVLKEIEPVLELNKNIYPKILFLGTGSSKPSKSRNTSGILVFLDEKSSIILDCGESTLTQLFRFFGREKSREILRNLKAIFVSHLHTDHHLGLITILSERKKSFMDVDRFDSDSSDDCDKVKFVSSGQSNLKPKPVYILAPPPLTLWLKMVEENFADISNAYEIILNSSLFIQNTGAGKLLKKIYSQTNIKNITTTFVTHCRNSFGVAITLKDGWKLTYSGDTMPCENLVKIGQNSDILIHEATMDDSLKEQALQKLHSTTSQAIEVGRKMNAKFILLTHFSQRYSYIPVFNDCSSENVGVAYDNMMVSANQLRILPKLNNAIKEAFVEHYERLEQRICSREQSKERKKNDLIDFSEKQAIAK